MNCPHCDSGATTRRKADTTLGYRRFTCRSCRRRFNERTGTPFNDLQCPTDVVLRAVLWRLRYKLSFRDVAEMLLQRGFEVTHETIRAWEFRFAPLLADQLRARRRGRAGESWYLDETYVKVAGRWCYLYRAIDRDGELIDSMLSEQRDKHAARRFLRRLVEVAEGKPAHVTTDRHHAYRRAIRWIIGPKAWHRTAQYLNNYTEQSHRAVKQRYHPMLGFGSFGSALGVIAGWRAGRLDKLIMRTVDVQLALPAILFAVLLAAVWGPSLRNVLILLTLFLWTSYARLVRGETLSLRERDFVTAATAMGASDFRIITRHIVPNVLNLVVILATLEVASVILVEAALSFLGVGVAIGTPSWGAMVAEGRNYITIAWWLTVIPGVVILLVALSGNLAGDWLRDAIDPRMRNVR